MDRLGTEAVRRLRKTLDGRSIAFVPTMGALHRGHLSLVEAARESADLVVASIFVNPTQFGPGEDLDRYPRDLDGDTELLEREGVDYLYFPKEEEIYPAGFDTYLVPERLSTIYEGEERPGHFRGVATVVYRLLAIVRPTLLFIGQKDAQQCVVIESLIRDLDLPVEVRRCRTIREQDGLALSSRNRYLSAEERQAATSLSRALAAARDCYATGAELASVREAATQVLASEPLVATDYIAIVNGDDYTPIAKPLDPRGLMALACRLGSTRLIDNCWLK